MPLKTKLWAVIPALLASACSNTSPQIIEPPPISHPELAQITVKRDLRFVGGGVSYEYFIYDVGTGIDHDVPAPRRGEPPIDNWQSIYEITPELFQQMGRVARIWFEVVDSDLKKFNRVDPHRDHERVVERIDETLIGATLLARPADNGGKNTEGGSERGSVQRVKLRLLYDPDEKTLYRVIEYSGDRCTSKSPGLHNWIVTVDEGLTFGSNAERAGLSDSTIDELERAFIELAPDFKYRSGAFIYSEICGWRSPVDLDLTGRYMGSTSGFDQETWYRPSGKMAILAVQFAKDGSGFVYDQDLVYANEIIVEAGKQYVALYDPYGKTLVVEAAE